MHKPTLLSLVIGIASVLALSPVPAADADEPIEVVTSFSILADMVEHVGGEHVRVTSLVGADSDAHVFSPSPGDARALTQADLVVFNGLQFEGWIERLIDSSDYAGPLVVATQGLDALADDAHAAHDEAGRHAHDHAHEGGDPHAWQDLAKGRVYVANIRDGLIEADPGNASTYRDNAERYSQALQATDDNIRALLADIPASTAVITGHDSFGHFARAYGVHFLSPVGLSTESETSAANLAQLIDVIRAQNVRALFDENMTNPSMIRQLSEETGLPIAGTLYADALASEGEASTYLGMMQHNARLIHAALADAPEGDAHEHGHDH